VAEVTRDTLLVCVPDSDTVVVRDSVALAVKRRVRDAVGVADSTMDAESDSMRVRDRVRDSLTVTELENEKDPVMN
jgi:hypothetical protein